MHSFGKKLKDLRIESGYKQDEIAKILNVTTSAYGYYEQGRNEPSLETLKIIAQTFQVSTDYLLSLISTPNHPKYYPISEDLSLIESEILAIKKMKEVGLLEEISVDTNTNVDRLKRYWDFIKKEHEVNT